MRDQSAALEVALAQLERVAEVRRALGGSGRAAVGGPAGELTRAQAEEIERITGQFRAGAIADVEAIRQVSAVAAEAGASMRELAEGFRDAATESARAEVALDRAQELMAKVADGAEANLGGRTIDQFEGLARAREDDIQGWQAWYHELVGGSIIPDMVTEFGVVVRAPWPVDDDHDRGFRPRSSARPSAASRATSARSSASW